MRFALLIEPNGRLSFIECISKFVPASTISTAVGGWFEEAAYIPVGDESYTLWWNADPIDMRDENPVARVLYAGKHKILSAVTLVGNVVVTGGPNENGETLPLVMSDAFNIFKNLYLSAIDDPTPFIDVETAFIALTYMKGA
jgi:hypothetical protein